MSHDGPDCVGARARAAGPVVSTGGRRGAEGLSERGGRRQCAAGGGVGEGSAGHTAVVGDGAGDPDGV